MSHRQLVATRRPTPTVSRGRAGLKVKKKEKQTKMNQRIKLPFNQIWMKETTTTNVTLTSPSAVVCSETVMQALLRLV